MLTELRADGRQTMIPPSLHPKSCWLRWAGGMSEPFFPARIWAVELRRAVAKTAAAAFQSRYWSAPGGRDEAALDLDRWLVKSGCTDEDAETFILAAARAAQDEEWKRRARETARSREEIASVGRQ
jgi:hypothetical protein